MASEEDNSIHLSNSANDSNNNNNDNQIETYQPDESEARWVSLHNFHQIKKAKIEQQRKRLYDENDKQYYSQCTFTPKINSLPSYLTKRDQSIDDSKSDNILQSTYDILARQEIWLNKTKEKREAMLNEANNKNNGQYDFKPKLTALRTFNQTNFHEKILDVIEDPESYTNYLLRLDKIKTDKKKKAQRNNAIAGSGMLWKRAPLKVNDYDYKKHELFPLKKNSCRDIMTTRKTNYNYYHYYNTEGDVLSINDNNMLMVTKPRNYGEGLNELHKKLLSLKLMNE